ncbi:MAG: O-antigen ligase family protein [Candidatus Marinimicrobia bacterium]|jgi:hypothetical protein|nr:O-antigen ligase family protein [Candidatus Neomarinimicrobiota bacterium]MBT3936143.1 O-antigen ligase family protein [Candidatus Neomarinimicrobiota bacterium]MBT3961114.1 O-antigen ligase family protein [Candidatus Neomarinimicrobiota bacterium]MBT4383040.1 O-antigen ligase family protein [Candidatus Neomarinimicrobiota bacterium]MBT4636464.1 O-antigen ligase family protein [Candidatus Neomarinimicrobiota bacterium]
MKKLTPLIIIHILLAPVIKIYPIIGSIHAITIASLAVYYMLTDRSFEKGLLLMGYILGSELLWRGFGANVFWEFGKISILILLIIILFRLGYDQFKLNTGILFIAFLLPSIFIMNDYSDFTHALLGPIVIGLSVLIFFQIKLNKLLLKKILFSILLPIITIFTITFWDTFNSGTFNFTSAYIYRVETGGVGPNQMSNILGLGAFISFLLYRINNTHRSSIIFLIIFILTITQTILTHSRGGFWNASLAIIVFYYYEIGYQKNKLKYLGSIVILLSFLNFGLFPLLDSLSGGSIVDRFTDASLSSREEIINTEISIFNKYPVFGIGPGQSRKYRLEYFGNYKHSHTEYTRLLAEHGLFGFFALLTLVYIIFQVYTKKGGLEKSISLAIIVWGVLFMFHSATRLVAPCFLIGFASAQFQLKEEI